MIDDRPSIWIEPTEIRVTLNGEPLAADEQYCIARRGFWLSWKYWRYRPWKALRAWRDRNTHYITFRFPPRAGETVTVEVVPSPPQTEAEK